jgi:integrase
MKDTAEQKKVPKKSRNSLEINQEKEGAVRNINGKVYLDFSYLDDRARVNTHLAWDGVNGKNVTQAREQLDLIKLGIKHNLFVFAETFPQDKRCAFFSKLEIEHGKRKISPNELLIKEHIEKWLNHLRIKGVTGRTLNGYNSNCELYILPYWGEKTFADLEIGALDGFYDWARKQEYKKGVVSNQSLNVYIAQLIRIGAHAARTHRWQSYRAFVGYEKLKAESTIHDPFTVCEEKKLIEAIDPFFKPYVDFAFATGLSVGELDGLDTKSVDITAKKIYVTQVLTLDENGNRIIARPKNQYRVRTLQMNQRILKAAIAQLKLRERLQLKSDFFFCMPSGSWIDRSAFRKNFWLPAIEAAGIAHRPACNARHTFATHRRDNGDSPIAIAKSLGHVDTTMTEKRYTKYKATVEGIQIPDDALVIDHQCIGNGHLQNGQPLRCGGKTAASRKRG